MKFAILAADYCGNGKWSETHCAGTFEGIEILVGFVVCGILFAVFLSWWDKR